MSGQQPPRGGGRGQNPRPSYQPHQYTYYGAMPQRPGSAQYPSYYYSQPYAQQMQQGEGSQQQQQQQPSAAQMQQWQQYYQYQGSYNPYAQGIQQMHSGQTQQQGSQHAAAPQVVAKKKILAIVDPKTNQHIDIPRAEKPSAADAASNAATPPPATNATTSETSAVEKQVEVVEKSSIDQENEAKAKAEQAKLAAEQAKRKAMEEQKKEADEKEEMELKKKAEELELKKKQLEEEKDNTEVTDDAIDELADDTAEMDLEDEFVEDEEIDMIPHTVTPSGKIVYQVEDLLSVKSKITRVPESIRDVNFDLVVVRPGMPRGASGRGQFQQGGSMRNQQWARGGQKGGRGGARPPQGGLEVKPIVVGENAWKPTKASDDLEATVKKVKGILNKLTLEKFDKLSTQVIEIPMKSMAMIRDTVGAIFDKALSEPNFGELYARLCKEIVAHTTNQEWEFISIVQKENKFYFTVSMDENEDLSGPYKSHEEAQTVAKKVTDFKRMLLNKCQEEFDKDNQIADAEEKVQDMKKKIDEETDDAKATELRLQLQDVTYEALQTKRRVLGNIQFIGELYKQKVLTEKVMHQCIAKLLITAGPKDRVINGQKIPEEEDLECLCRLLTTIGSTLDASRNASTEVNEYYKRLAAVAQAPGLPARLKFMVLDVIDLRKNNWQARREELKAKKIEDVHKDAKREEQEKAKMTARGGGGNYRPQQGQGNRGQGNQRGGNMGPRGGLGNVAQGNQMGTGGGTKIGGAARKGAPLQQSLSSRPNSATSGNRTAPTSFRPNGSGTKKTTTKPEYIDDDTMERNIKNGFVEYVEMQMSDELITTFKEISEVTERTKYQNFVVRIALEMIIEKKDDARRFVPRALVTIIKETDLLDEMALVEGIDQKLSTLSDDRIDNPYADKFVASFLAELISSEVLHLGNLFRCMQLLGQQDAHVQHALLAKTLKLFEKDYESVWKEHSQDFKLSDFITSTSDQERFISDNDFGNLLA